MKVKVLGRDFNNVTSISFPTVTNNMRGKGKSWFLMVKLHWKNEYPFNGLFQDLLAGNFTRDKAHTISDKLDVIVKSGSTNKNHFIDIDPLLSEILEMES